MESSKTGFFVHFQHLCQIPEDGSHDRLVLHERGGMVEPQALGDAHHLGCISLALAEDERSGTMATVLGVHQLPVVILDRGLVAGEGGSLSGKDAAGDLPDALLGKPDPSLPEEGAI